MKLPHLIYLSPAFVRSLGRLPLGHLLYLARHMRHENARFFAGKLRINSFFPPYPSPAFDRFLSAVIARKRMPHSVYYAVTDTCPFSCPQCSYGNHVAGSPDTCLAIDTISQIKALGTGTLGITGGEPLLREDLPALVAAAGAEMTTVLFTTGFGLTACRAAELKAAGLGCIMISLESACRAEHDRLRGYVGSFDAAMQAIRMSLEAGLYTAVSVVATQGRINSGELEAIYQLAAEKGVMEMRVLEPLATGSLYRCGHEHLTGPESQWLIDFHKIKNRLHAGPSVCCFSHMESAEMFGCGAGYHHLYIDAAGNVCPCDLTPLGMGNLAEKSLAEIWAEMGEYFARPRCSCLMKELADMPGLGGPGDKLPLAPEVSRELLTKVKAEELPGMYQRIL